VTRPALAGVSAFALAYVLAEPMRVPVLLYDPWTRTATISAAMTSHSMRYFGDLLLATVAAFAAAALFQRVRPRMPIAVTTSLSLAIVALAAAWCLRRVLAPG
jgi:hypothetical protein